jgi:leucyl-tRNA synthetase
MDQKPLDITQLQDKWKHVWHMQGNADISNKPKFFLIWAYLTVSGFHHVGHMRGYSYADAICRFKRLKGYNVLLTAGGHASGNSAVAKAKKVTENDPETIAYYKDMGLNEQEINQLKTPEGFVQFFAQKYLKDYQEYAFIGDWSRFTLTTNPDYNKFIEWQFKKLKSQGLLVQKPYYATWCDSCGAVAVDPSESDISKGGNAQKVEYTLIKLPLSEQVFVVVATLRPETMYGQTNVWVHPDATYAKVKVGNETWIVSEPCAKKLVYQIDNVTHIGTIHARELIGKEVRAVCKESYIPILPATFCDPTIATGIVTSVPSDAPADYIALKDLQTNQQLCATYGLDYKKITQIQPIPIIQSKGLSTCAAKDLVEELKITSQSDPALAAATAAAYKKGFHTGILLDTCGPYAGMKVEDAKKAMREKLLERNQAHIFVDLSEEVVSRYGDPVYIKRVEGQWFIKYSDPKLTQDTISHAKTMNLMPEQFKQNIPQILEWFEDRACARMGRWLGTKLPFDTEYTIEPIADSTLYPIYYLVSKYVNEKHIAVHQLTESFFDYVFLGKGDVIQVARETSLSTSLIEKVRQDVLYWYPLDLNLGGKEHQTVHFPVFLMNHRAILADSMQPKGIFVNWWVTSKGGKISKSKGGAKSIQDEAKKYSVDAIRLYYANISSPFSDILFEEEELVKCKQKLERIISTCDTIRQATNSVEHVYLDTWLAYMFSKRMSTIQSAMDTYEFKMATDALYFGISSDIAWYQKRGGTNTDLLKHLIVEWAVCMSMFTPNVAEEIHSWFEPRKLASASLFPSYVYTHNPAIELCEDMVDKVTTDIYKVKELAKIAQPKKITVILSHTWKYEVLAQLAQLMQNTKDQKAILTQLIAAHKSVASELVALVQKQLKSGTAPTIVTTQDMEFVAFSDAKQYVETTHGCKVEVVRAQDSGHPKAASAMPLKPALVIE